MSEIGQEFKGAYSRLVDAITNLVKSDDEVVSDEDKDYVRAKPVEPSYKTPKNKRLKTKMRTVEALLDSGDEWTIKNLNSAASTTSSKDYIYRLRQEGKNIRDRWADKNTHKIFWVSKSN